VINPKRYRSRLVAIVAELEAASIVSRESARLKPERRDELESYAQAEGDAAYIINRELLT